MNPLLEKQRLRQQLLAMRANLSDSERTQFSLRIHDQVMQLSAWKQARRIGCYLALPGEVDSDALIISAQAQGKIVAAPVVTRENKHMTFYTFNGLEDLTKGPFNLRQPRSEHPLTADNLDLLLVPALAFDVHGHRLGFGQGYYDRYLSRYTGLRLGLAFSWQVVDHLPITAYDQPMNMVITEKDVFEAL